MGNYTAKLVYTVEVYVDVSNVSSEKEGREQLEEYLNSNFFDYTMPSDREGDTPIEFDKHLTAEEDVTIEEEYFEEN